MAALFTYLNPSFSFFFFVFEIKYDYSAINKIVINNPF